jgi:hypothetical protein
MIPDIDIWRCATVMIKRYGQQAEIEAARRADEHLSTGVIDAQRVWVRIAKAIYGLQTVQPGETRH